MGLHTEEFRFSGRIPSVDEIADQLREQLRIPAKIIIRQLIDDKRHQRVVVMGFIVDEFGSGSHGQSPLSTTAGSVLVETVPDQSNHFHAGSIELDLDERRNSVHLYFQIGHRHGVSHAIRLALRKLGGRHVGRSRVQRQTVREQRLKHRRIFTAIALIPLIILIAAVIYCIGYNLSWFN